MSDELSKVHGHDVTVRWTNEDGERWELRFDSSVDLSLLEQPERVNTEVKLGVVLPRTGPYVLTIGKTRELTYRQLPRSLWRRWKQANLALPKLRERVRVLEALNQSSHEQLQAVQRQLRDSEDKVHAAMRALRGTERGRDA